MSDGSFREALAAGGEVGRDLLAVDWDATPLGPPEAWPQSLRTVVRVMLTSRFSMWMGWGPELTFFCNEAYRRDTLGTKYPWALGRPAREVWAEIWDEIGPRIATVLHEGAATWDEALMLFLERSGYAEETYHTFSYSPLHDDEGDVAGLFCVVSEETERVIGERRLASLRDLGAQAAGVRSEAELLAALGEELSRDAQDLPFTLIYLVDDEAHVARLAATSAPDARAVAPAVVALDDTAPWPLADVLAGRRALVSLADRPGLPTGAWREPPTQALVAPLVQQGQGPPYGFLVAALNRYRPLDEGSTAFVDLVAGQVAAAIASARAYDAERRRAEALAELDHAKTAFFTNVSHELRTPLTLLLGPAEDALADQREPLAPGQRERVELVARNGARLLRLVNTLLDFSRLESRRVDARFEPVDLGRLTVDLVSMFESAVEHAGLGLEVEVTPLAEPVYVDAEMWAKIVLNLLSNALKFTFDGQIRVAVDEWQGRARLRVSDSGIGIAQAEQARLFERFHRVSDARSRSHEGSGIGLALVGELVALHGGQVSVDSIPGDGSTFTVLLPLGREHLPDDHVATASGDGEVATRQAEGFLAEAMRWLEAPALDHDGAADGRTRVLVVDDNADMREYVSSLLRGEYSVEIAADGADALQLARRTPPDLVLTDVMMPRLDGFGLLAALRGDAATAQTPVIMLSARAGEDGTIEGLEAGADDYLVKPFSARELLARVRASLELDRVRATRDQLRRSQELLDQAQRLARLGSWELDLSTWTLTGSDEYLRHIGMTRDELAGVDAESARLRLVHPDDVDRVREALTAALAGAPMDYEARLVRPDGAVGTYRTIGELERDAQGRPARLRGSHQDVTEQRAAERVLAQATAEREASARERRIADELQRSLLPPRTVQPPHLEVATFYQPGVEGTQVGGDWYDVIEIGAHRTALVLGDVMGRGVRAAAVMGQLRSAVRAYSRLALRPGEVLERLDGLVEEIGPEQIVTCIYAVYSPHERCLLYANAGHLPPVLSRPGEETGPVEREVSAPLGTGAYVPREHELELPPGSRLALYTDGLVERRDRPIDAGIAVLARCLADAPGGAAAAAEALVGALVAGGSEDDVALLVARVPDVPLEPAAVIGLPYDTSAARGARAFVDAVLRERGVPPDVRGAAAVIASEMATNAALHGRPPLELHVRTADGDVLLEVYDRAPVVPHRLEPTADDEHGRGLRLIAGLGDDWGVRLLPVGKAVWCVLRDRDCDRGRQQSRG